MTLPRAFPVRVFKLEVKYGDVAEPVCCAALVGGGDLGHVPRAGRLRRLLVVGILQGLLTTPDNNNKLHFRTIFSPLPQANFMLYYDFNVLVYAASGKLRAVSEKLIRAH